MNSRNKNKKQFDSLTSEINPHMPQYLVQAPWYINQTDNSLNHQKTRNSLKLPITQYTERGLLGNNVYKFRKGACDNCGALTHKTKECCERPRKRGARFTQSNFCSDEYINEVPLDYEGKRDRWNGYQPEMGKRLIYEYQQIEEEKNKIKSEKIKNAKTEREKRLLEKDEDLEEDISADEENDIPDIFKQVVQQIKNTDTNESKDNNIDSNNLNDQDVKEYFEDYKHKNNNSLPEKITDIPKRILYQISTSKSLHIGEDYSKYLLNLALNSAYYDAKSRSMRENPLATTLINTFKGENYLRQTGDAAKLLEMENFVDIANSKNKDLNLNNIAMPSQAELFYRYFKEKKDQFKTERLKKAVEKYGGDSYFSIPDSIKISENYDKVDNSQMTNNFGVVKSSYNEDVYINNHTTVWGSFYHDKFGWGYKCCYSFNRESICGGESAKEENEKRIKDYEDNIVKGIKDSEKEKREKLQKMNEKEAKAGAFSEILNHMEKFESSNEIIGKKTKRDDN